MTQLTVLLPALQRIVDVPLLAVWLAHGDALPVATPGSEAVLRECFTWQGDTLPSAALTRQFDRGDAGTATWLRADPAYIRAEMTTARMLACGELGLSEPECAEFADALQPLFADEGMAFDAATPQRWYLNCREQDDVLSAAAPDDAIGDDLKLHLPQGPSGRRWRVLFNEAQVLLHNHPRNAVRIAQGQAPVNGLWFWGAGRLPAQVQSARAFVASDDPVVRELARLAGVAEQALTPISATTMRDGSSGNSLVDLRNQRGEVLQNSWLVPLDARLRQHAGAQMMLLFECGQRVRVRGWHRWRFWRRATSGPAAP